MSEQSGLTSRQMVSATQGAVFVWCNSNLHYPRSLARHLGREDLKIVSPSWIKDRLFAGPHGVAVVVDHAWVPQGSDWDAVEYLYAYITRDATAVIPKIEPGPGALR